MILMALVVSLISYPNRATATTLNVTIGPNGNLVFDPASVTIHPGDKVTRQTVIGYLSGATLIGAAVGPTLPMNWQLVGAADFNGDGHPDYLIYRPDTRQTAIWHLNNNVFIDAVSGLTLPPDWTLLSH